MKFIKSTTTYARTTSIYELEENEMNLTVQELESKFNFYFGGYVIKNANGTIEVVRYDD